MKKYTVTITANMHIRAKNEDAALEIARTTLPSEFDLIEDEVKDTKEDESIE